MKKIKSFNDFGKVNEIVTKKSAYYDFDKAKQDPDVKALFAEIAKLIEASPIAFELTEKNDGFDVKGPFGMYMYVSVKKEKRPGSPSYNPSYDKVGVSVTIDKSQIASGSPKDLWSKLKKSFEFKQFIKGAKIEKMRKGRLDRIIKEMSADADMDTKARHTIDYLYYSEPKTITNKSDNAGPHATTGTSIRTYAYDLAPVIAVLGEDDVDTIIDEYKDDILKKLGYVSRYLVDVDVMKYELTGEGSLVIQEKSTVWYN